MRFSAQPIQPLVSRTDALRRLRTLPHRACRMLVAAGLVALPALALAAVQLTTLDNGNFDEGTAVTSSASGDIVIGASITRSGSSSQFTVFKLNAAGQVQWQASPQLPAGFLGGRVHAVRVDAAGQVYAAGHVLRALSATQSLPTWIVVSFDAQGRQRWAHWVETGPTQRTEATHLRLDNAGNAYVAGPTAGASGGGWRLIKYAASNGQLLWERVSDPNGAPQDLVTELALDALQQPVLLRVVHNQGFDQPSDIAVAKFSAEGAALWQFDFSQTPDTQETATALTIDGGSGNIYVAGSINPGANPEGEHIPFTLSLTGQGVQRWVVSGNGLGGSAFGGGGAGIAPNGDIVVAGRALALPGFSNVTAVSRLNSNGQRLWSTEVLSAGPVFVAGDGSVWVGGERISATGVRDIFATRLSSAGTILSDEVVTQASDAKAAHLDGASARLLVLGNSGVASAERNVLLAAFTAQSDASPLGAPSNLSLRAGKGQLALEWRDNASNETHQVIERAVGSGGFAVLATVPARAFQYTDRAVERRITYRYRVKAVGSTGESAYSNQVSGTPR